MAKLRVRARTVDMLGRQQIAGIPNAIHELFKNAHDAYAESVEVDYFHHNDLFVVRDDGIGMTKDEFVQRWLTLGTESKLGQGGLAPPERPKGMRVRPILGEKGVGRLAIAAIGPQVLVATKSYKTNSKIAVSFINWSFFELPGIDLDEIDIPVETVSEAEYRKGHFVKRLVSLTKKQVKVFEGRSDSEILRRIKSELDQVDFTPFQYDGSYDGPSLIDDGQGTHYFIFPADPIIKEELSVAKDNFTASPLDKFLLGFSDAWIPKTVKSLINAKFREHHEDATTFELTGSERFFSHDDFDSADHLVKGKFDDRGNFLGTVTVYGQQPTKVNYEWSNWNGFSGGKTHCGPIIVTFGYVQGTASESRLPPSEHAEIFKKLRKFGALYVYRDRLRVLPYGDTDFDFLDIEKRRTLGAAYYFYSYRRMFGAINISQEHNRQLVEKAGREGFRQNKAYFEFKDLLVGLLLRTARDFFREKGEFAEDYFPIKRELNKKAKLEKERAKYTRKARQRLKREIDSFFARIARGEPADTALSLEQSIEESLGRFLKVKKAELNVTALDIEKRFDSIFRSAISQYEIMIPSDIGLGKKLERECNAYLREYTGLKREVFAPIKKKFRQQFEETLKAANARRSINRRMIGRELLDSAITEYQSRILERRDSVLSQSRTIINKLCQKAEHVAKDFETDTKQVVNDYVRKTKGKPTNAKLYRERQSSLAMLDVIYFDGENKLSELIAATETVRSLDTEGGVISKELVAALEEKIANQSTELEDGLELMQIGTALGIVQHEFLNTIQQVRSGIAKLKPWADVNPDLVSLYDSIHHNFEHLSGYLKLFDPLSRRLNPVKIEISGNEILKYLKDFFGERLSRHDIELNATSTFRRKKINSYTSTFYPVFVNLVDNAIYWLTNYKEVPREIMLDANVQGFVVKDNGPGIEPRYREAIFDFGFTQKTVGRGMGLYISREVLQKEQHDLILLSCEEGEGTSFLIKLAENGAT